ncbi:FecR family protein [Algibacter miyuki]|uniref:FecR family protein n=1 Tax=Algibacter miyuki TaxID=1306933 RepID=A0ABV5GY86_9FLAO|nr:FecR domain-containing protein [Algibacter miyuki]MDN3667188.1 DUF4974 domain-containing protein [Algibacter miyuki]
MTVKDFLENDYFMLLMLIKDDETKKYWELYLDKHPGDRANFEAAKVEFSNVKFNSERLSSDNRELLHQRIFENSNKVVRTHKLRKFYYVAAACALIFVFLGIYSTSDELEVQQIIVEKATTDTSIQLITKDKTFSLPNNEVLTVSETGITNAEGENLETNTENSFNTLKVPFGKRSELVLADGSKLWVNSGSTVRFPSKFNTDNRTIHVEGEIYIEVFKDKTKPFKVETSRFDVNVYGTTFDVKAYENSNDQRVVLVEGSVGVSTIDNMEADMVPNESLDISSSQLVKKNVDTEMYTSWKNGYLIFDDTPIESILLELSRYYNVSFSNVENDLKGESCTGKIYLSSNLEDVLETLSTLSNNTFKIQNNDTN